MQANFFGAACELDLPAGGSAKKCLESGRRNDRSSAHYANAKWQPPFRIGTSTDITMAKSQNSKKETKKAPQRTAKEKKQAKREKKG